MSRYVESFNAHAFHQQWENFKNNFESLESFTAEQAQYITEVARIQKSIKHIDDIIDAIDPELAPLSIWGNIDQQIKNMNSELNSFLSNVQISHLYNVSNYIDNILSLLSPFVTNHRQAAKSAGVSFKIYATTVEKELEKIIQKFHNLSQFIAKKQESINEIAEQSQIKKQSIDSYSNILFEGDNNSPSIQERISNLNQEIINKHEKIEEFYNKLITGNEEESPIILQINNNLKDTKESKEESKKLENDIRYICNKINDFSKLIYGKKNEEETDTPDKGLKIYIENLKSELEKTIKEHKDKYNTLEYKIESLLPGATSAGLTSAYRKRKLTSGRITILLDFMFVISLLFLFAISSSFIIEEINNQNIKFIKITELNYVLTNIIFKIPLLLPPLWLAVSISKRRNQEKRLFEEYAHKEALASSFESFKEEITKLKREDNKLMEQLLEQAIAAIGYNASKTLDGRHEDNGPILDTIYEAIKRSTPPKIK